ncbi:hypothetical protein COV82_02945 [Candidatus Peregrinibacteria bacterium CG11_big_fil_rev_8_21_14_0_20_46_8]|nr:MAG: hypothetical protein COV82_02945 [Candidatus Peregrinibacteria bacterium CG11_big_fil_rev_8_21_14_0_20_46_8]
MKVERPEKITEQEAMEITSDAGYTSEGPSDWRSSLKTSVRKRRFGTAAQIAALGAVLSAPATVSAGGGTSYHIELENPEKSAAWQAVPVVAYTGEKIPYRFEDEGRILVIQTRAGALIELRGQCPSRAYDPSTTVELLNVNPKDNTLGPAVTDRPANSLFIETEAPNVLPTGNWIIPEFHVPHVPPGSKLTGFINCKFDGSDSDSVLRVIIEVDSGGPGGHGRGGRGAWEYPPLHTPRKGARTGTPKDSEYSARRRRPVEVDEGAQNKLFARVLATLPQADTSGLLPGVEIEYQHAITRYLLLAVFAGYYRGEGSTWFMHPSGDKALSEAAFVEFESLLAGAGLEWNYPLTKRVAVRAALHAVLAGTFGEEVPQGTAAGGVGAALRLSTGIDFSLAPESWKDDEEGITDFGVGVGVNGHPAGINAHPGVVPQLSFELRGGVSF